MEAFRYPFIQRETIKTASQRLPINCFDLLLCCIFLRKRIRLVDVSSLHLDFGARVITCFPLLESHLSSFTFVSLTCMQTYLFWFSHRHGMHTFWLKFWGNELSSKNGCLTVGRYTSSSKSQISKVVKIEPFLVILRFRGGEFDFLLWRLHPLWSEVTCTKAS